jgi:hypothetical protein
VHGVGDWFIGLKPQMADKNFILMQNNISENERKSVAGSISQGRNGLPGKAGNRGDYSTIRTISILPSSSYRVSTCSMCVAVMVIETEW